MTAPTGVASVIATDAPTAPVPTTAPTTIISTTTPSTGSVTASTNILPVAFEVNQGQAADDVSYVAHAVGYTALFNGQGMTVRVLSAATLPITPPLPVPTVSLADPTPSLATPAAGLPLTETAAISGAVLGFGVADAAVNPQVVTQGALPGVANYLTGNDPTAWHLGVPTYAGLTYKNILPGVDLTYQGSGGHLESAYTFAPGTDPASITLTVAGAQGLALDGAGNLVLHTAAGDLTQSKPVAYQTIGGQRQAVDAQYVLRGVAGVGVTVGAYDPSQPLVIDPVLSYRTYLGGSGDDEANAVALDDTGAYVTGQTNSTNFPTTNAFQSTYGGGAFDAFVAKFNVNATALAYSSYLGGSGEDEGYGIAAGGIGSAAVVGTTTSPDFPTTSDALQATPADTYNGFVTGLASHATRPGLLGYSTYLHGSTGDVWGSAIAKDGQSNVVGWSTASDLPGTAGTQQASNAGGADGFLSKFITTPTCPSGEDCVDIGDPALTGDQLQSGSRANGTWAVTGSGADIWGTADQFHYVAQDAAGDGSISARILSQDNTGQFAKAGVMYRASEDPSAPYYHVVMTPYNGGWLQVQYRPTQGAAAVDLTATAATLPLYVRVRRSGHQFTTDTSSDGQTWNNLANATITLGNMPMGVLAGLAVTSYNTGVASTATFDHVTITSCPVAWDCSDIGSPAQAGDQTIRDAQDLESLVNFPVRGGGADIWGTFDQFHYVHAPFRGDGAVSARLSSQDNTDGWAKAGVMLRASTDPGAPYYFVMITPGVGVNVQYRDGQGASAQVAAINIADTVCRRKRCGGATPHSGGAGRGAGPQVLPEQRPGGHPPGHVGVAERHALADRVLLRRM